MGCCVCACQFTFYIYLHVVKAAETVDLPPISRILEITPSPSPCPTHPLQGNTHNKYVVNIEFLF